MQLSSTFRAALVAFVAVVGLSSAARADSGTITLTIYKAGWVIGGSGGGGTPARGARGWPCRPSPCPRFAAGLPYPRPGQERVAPA